MEDNNQNKEHQISKEEKGKLLDHNYDGIQELDNPPPRWIMAIFYITIGFSILYGAYYFFLGVGDHQNEKYAKKSLLHDEKYQLASDDATQELIVLTDAADLEEGKTIYKDMGCFACHGMLGEGNAIGPNITDEYWLNGGEFADVVNIIKNGKPTKGMTAFKAQISDTKILKVASYVMSLVGSNPPNAKAPQGEPMK